MFWKQQGNADILKEHLIERKINKLSACYGEIETLYNTHGDLLADCDVPYSEQSRYSIGNIHEKSVFAMLAECASKSEKEDTSWMILHGRCLAQT